MSKIFLKSETSSMQLRLQRRRKQHAKELILKPYDFCCSINNVDPLTQYDRLRSFYRASLMSLQTRTGNPTLKLRTEFTDYIDPAVRLLQRKKSFKNKQLDIGDHRYKNKKNMQIFKKPRKIYKGKKLDDDFEFEDLHDKKVTSLLQGPLHWYLEDEIVAAKDILWEQKQRAYNEEMNKNIEIGKEKMKAMMVQETDIYPRWYQDFSINQIKNLRMLQCIMHKDCEEMVTRRTRRTLLSIGIISTFFTLTPDVVKKLQETCNCNVIEFLREIYKILTGNYFEEEGYKNFYDCNEKIILSAIAFLTLPETIIELHKRLPSVTVPKLPSKPIPLTLPKRQKKKTPYKEKLFMRADWATFYNSLQNWQEQRRQMSIPNVILPPKDCILSNYINAKINSYYEGNKCNEVQNISQNKPTCDSCCSCRQTRKSYLKAKETKAPYFVIDTITEDENKKKYIVGSMAMHSPAPTPPESTMNLLEVIASEDVLTDNIIIKPSPPRPPRNVPPCVCAIQQMFSKGLSSNVSHDNIPWTKEEGLCFGKKFRPHEHSAYSCKKYPGDKSCRRNPFIHDINKLKRRIERAKEEKTGETKEKKKMYSIADFKPCGDEHGMNICGGPWGALHTLTPEELAEQERLRKEILKSPPCGTKPGRAVCEGPFGERIPFKPPEIPIEKEIPGEEDIEEEEKEIEEEEALTKPPPVEVKKKEKKRDIKCYDDPWNIFRTAPSVKESETDFKKLLKLSSPRPPATPVPSKVIDESERSTLHKDITKSDIKRDRPIVKKISPTQKNSSHNPKYLEKQSEGSNSKKFSKQISSIKLPDKPQNYMRNVTNYEINKQDKKGKNSKKLNPKFITSSDMKKKKINKRLSTRKRSIKRDKKKNVHIDQDINPETAYKNKIHELKNMMKSTNIYPYDIKPVEIPDNPPAKCQLEYEDLEPAINAVQIEEDTDAQPASKDPCGWKTKSEQQLPTKKTLVYLTDPDYPPETIPIRPGGKPCMQVIDGVIYYTPPPSPRRSDEYVPEYDVSESPYDMCLTQRKDRNLKFLERYNTPKISEVPENKESCGCSEYIDTYGIQATNENEKKVQLLKELETRDKLISAKPPKERWNLALKDVGLIDYFTRCRDSLPCWLKCAKFNKVGCPVLPRKLKIKRPVCECEYERKILEHREEKAKWKERQKRLKSLKKHPYVNVSDISKPLVPNTKLMISDVKRIPREDEYIDDIKYCITGVAENYDYLPPKQVVGGIHMATPIQTPEPSVQEIPCVCLHRHWSPTKITPGPLPKPEEILLVERKRRQEAVKEAFRQIYAPQSTYHVHDDHGCQEKCVKNLQKSSENKIRDLRKEDRDFKTKKRDQKRLNVPQKQAYREIKDDTQYNSVELDAEKIHALDEETEKDSDDTKCYLMAIVKIELKKMAAEGFLFAKLPKCFLMPQLRYWIMYRKGFNPSYVDKKKSVRNSIKMWNILDDKIARFEISVPSLKMTKIQLKKLTFDDAREIKAKIALKTAIFHSRIRKERVLYARSMWNSMEYGRFPSISFKRAYFTYMASKESDGHVFKPWLPIEVRDMNPKKVK
ncbi:hypothetical protein WN51_00702 [Melipona quadrifasciata]|uniref:DUF4771 domain-containing protein n=1 Tax=Melipona quadrifasciata TaxID=166423 RepID=A0A0N0BF33_9HYME|nr:hypothetical protein WN51_00702 [Melipona quadrifasciata]